MTVSIRNHEAEQLARELAQSSGKNITEVVLEALRGYQQTRQQPGKPSRNLADRLLAIGENCASLPTLDTRSDEDLIGYDEHGLP